MGKRIYIKVDELLKRNGGLSIRRLGDETSIRHATLSELKNHKRRNVSFVHLERIAEAFNITDMNELFGIEEVDDEDVE